MYQKIAVGFVLVRVSVVYRDFSTRGPSSMAYSNVASFVLRSALLDYFLNTFLVFLHRQFSHLKLLLVRFSSNNASAVVASVL